MTRVIHSFASGRAVFTPGCDLVRVDGIPMLCSNNGFPRRRPGGLEPAAAIESIAVTAPRDPAERAVPVATSPHLPCRGQNIMKRTYQASKVRRARTHGFLVRMKSRGGRAVINARRAKGRKRLSV